MVSQSGGTAMAVQGLAQQAGFGFRLMISSGNEAVLGITDYLEALVDDDGTAVIAVYLEGVRDGPAFANALARARRSGKPVVMLKAGRTAASGSRCCCAHRSARRRRSRMAHGIRRARGDHGAIGPGARRCRAVSSAAAAGKLPRGNGVAISTFGGGVGVLATDLCAQARPRHAAAWRQTRARLGTARSVVRLDGESDRSDAGHFQPPGSTDSAQRSMRSQGTLPSMRCSSLSAMAQGGRAGRPRSPNFASAATSRSACRGCSRRRRVPETLAKAGLHVFASRPARWKR